MFLNHSSFAYGSQQSPSFIYLSAPWPLVAGAAAGLQEGGGTEISHGLYMYMFVCTQLHCENSYASQVLPTAILI